MKRSLLYMSFFLLPLLALAQSLPSYTLTGENTVCGGNIKVDWSAAVTASIPIAQWRAELYDSEGTKLSQKDFDAAGKTQFSDLSSATYKVKILRKDGIQTHPTQLSQAVMSSYQRFVVTSKGQSVAEKATGECANNGKATIQIKDGAGPFVIKVYEKSTGNLVATSPATNKTGNSTAVQVTGLKADTNYQVEVTDQVGGGSCSITEPKTTHEFKTLGVSTSFLRAVTMETCRPLKAGETEGARGLITVDINNANAGAGPFTVKIIKDGGQVVVANVSIPKGGATGSTIKKIEPDAGKSFDANTYYTVQVTDGSCTAEKRVYRTHKYSPDYLQLFLAPSCNSNCLNYDLAFAAHYNERVLEEHYYPYKINLKITRGATVIANQDYNGNDALPLNRTEGKRHIYGANDEFGFWYWWKPKVHTTNVQVKAGDVISLQYTDCAGVTRTLSHTVAPPTNIPTTSAEVLPNTATSNACDKIVLLTTGFQRYVATNVIYNAFCNVAGIKYRAKRSGAVATILPGDPQKLFRFFDEQGQNLHRVKVQDAGTSYQMEYAESTAPLNGSNTKNCKHYLSTSIPSSSINTNPLSRIRFNVGGSVQTVLDFPGRGNKFYLGADDPLVAGLDFITNNNKLTVRIVRADGQPNVQEIDVQGPWNLKGKYKVKFPFTKVLYPAMNGGTDYIYQFFDFPPGKYRVELKDQCGNTLNRDITIGSVPNVNRQIDGDNHFLVTTACAQGGGTSKGKVIMDVLSEKTTTATPREMLLFSDENRGNGQPIHKRVSSSPLKSVSFNLTDAADPLKWRSTAGISDIAPGKYIVGVTIGPFLHSVIDPASAEERGYMYSYNPANRGDVISNTVIYKEIEIKNITEVTPTTAIGMCDPSDSNTGVIRVEMPTGSEPQYPITYTL